MFFKKNQTDEVETKVIKIISGYTETPIKKISKDSLISEDLCMDSNDKIYCTASLENEFKLGLNASDMSDVKTVQDVVDFIKGRLQ